MPWDRFEARERGGSPSPLGRQSSPPQDKGIADRSPLEPSSRWRGSPGPCVGEARAVRAISGPSSASRKIGAVANLRDLSQLLLVLVLFEASSKSSPHQGLVRARERPDFRAGKGWKCLRMRP